MVKIFLFDYKMNVIFSHLLLLVLLPLSTIRLSDPSTSLSSSIALMLPGVKPPIYPTVIMDTLNLAPGYTLITGCSLRHVLRDGCSLSSQKHTP